MKILNSFLIILASSFVLNSDGCITQEKICQISYIADLALDAFSTNLAFTDSQNIEYYDVSYAIINSISDIAGCDNPVVGAAAPSSFLQTIVYSESGTFEDAVITDEVLVDVNSLNAGNRANIGDQFGFGQDGTYDILSSIDVYNEVAERSENNNDNTNNIKHTFSTKIEISGVSNGGLKDNEGNPIYIIRNSPVTVEYH